jgi:hypothetical protein
LLSDKTGVSRREARLAFSFSQMETADFTNYYDVCTISYIDFLEAFCRVVYCVCPPSEAGAQSTLNCFPVTWLANISCLFWPIG